MSVSVSKRLISCKYISFHILVLSQEAAARNQQIVLGLLEGIAANR